MAYKNGDYKNYFKVTDKVIFGFFEQFRFLSNFHNCDVLWNGYIWPSSEHAYMASKCKNVSYRETLEGSPFYDGKPIKEILAMKSSQVKSWGQTVELREDWSNVKNNIMHSICLDKFTRNLDLKQKLLDTGERLLIEANSWGDSWWGFDVAKNKGENHLGKILMDIREKVK